MVETAITMPVMIFLVLGGLQIMMLQHGRIMTEYAAYNAVRAGIVNNGDWGVMQNAAVIGSLPLYARTDTPREFAKAWLKVKPIEAATSAIDQLAGTLERLPGDLLGVEISGIAQDISLVEVHVTSPTREAFRELRDWQQEQRSQSQTIDDKAVLVYPDGAGMDFDDVDFFEELHSNNPGEGRLAVEVRVLCPLKVPIINKLIFDLWFVQQSLGTRRIESDVTEWAEWRGRITRGGGTGQYVDEAVQQGSSQGPLDDFFTTTQWKKEIRTLRWIGEKTGLYFVPLYAQYAMQMQSNMFEGNRREPVWFTIEDF